MYRVYNFTGTTEQLVFKSNDKCYVHFICIVLREYCLCFQFIFHRPVSTVPSNCQCLSSKITFQLVNIVLAWFFYCIIEWLGESTGIYWEKEWRLYITKYKLQNKSDQWEIKGIRLPSFPWIKHHSCMSEHSKINRFDEHLWCHILVSFTHIQRRVPWSGKGPYSKECNKCYLSHWAYPYEMSKSIKWIHEMFFESRILIRSVQQLQCIPKRAGRHPYRCSVRGPWYCCSNKDSFMDTPNLHLRNSPANKQHHLTPVINTTSFLKIETIVSIIQSYLFLDLIFTL